MVVDIQGVDDLYTDPQIHSIHPRDQTRYGMGNLGLRGIGAFFRTHVCDVTCRRLRLPAVAYDTCLRQRGRFGMCPCARCGCCRFSPS